MYIEVKTCFVTGLQGMVEPGDTVSATLKKEFGEEAMNSLEATTEEKKRIEEQISKLFSHGEKVSEVLLHFENQDVYFLIYELVNKTVNKLLLIT